MRFKIQRVVELSFYTILFMFFFVSAKMNAQSLEKEKKALPQYLKGNDNDVYGTTSRFIENIGQYGQVYDKYPDMGNILYGYEGFNVPVLFTAKGLIYLHRKVEAPKLSEQEREERIKKKKKKEEEIEEVEVKDRAITMEWLNANGNPEIIADERTEEYHTYGFLQ